MDLDTNLYKGQLCVMLCEYSHPAFLHSFVSYFMCVTLNETDKDRSGSFLLENESQQ